MYYSTPEDGGGEADPSHQIYNRLTHDTLNTGGQSQDTEMNSTLQGNYEMGEYSTMSNCRQSHGGTGKEVSTADQPLPQLLHHQVKKKDEDKYTADSQEEWSQSAIYAQVDKKKSKKKEKIPPQTPEPEQMYAQVDKKKSKKKEKILPQIPEPYMSLEQMYAQVDKKKNKKKEKILSQTPEPYIPLDQSKKREVSEDTPYESGEVYSVVNKPSAPEIPHKSELLLKDLN